MKIRLEPSSFFLSVCGGSFLLRQGISDLEELPVMGAMTLGMLLEAKKAYGSDCSASWDEEASVIRVVGFSLSPRYHNSAILTREMGPKAPLRHRKQLLSYVGSKFRAWARNNPATFRGTTFGRGTAIQRKSRCNRARFFSDSLSHMLIALSSLSSSSCLFLHAFSRLSRVSWTTSFCN